MPRVLSFERELYATLDLMPLTMRRRLDLAFVKLSLAGWQALPLDDRRALVAAEVEGDASVAAFATTLREVAARVGVGLEPLPPGAPPWRTADARATVRAAAAALGVEIDEDAWAGLDDEARFALVHLSGKRRDPERLGAALVDLGLGAGATGEAPISPARPV